MATNYSIVEGQSEIPVEEKVIEKSQTVTQSMSMKDLIQRLEDLDRDISFAWDRRDSIVAEINAIVAQTSLVLPEQVTTLLSKTRGD